MRTAEAQKVIGLSISYEGDKLLTHLREMLIELARALLRQGICLAFGGHWKEGEENFTYALLRLISAEQKEYSVRGGDILARLGRLISYTAWPYYLDIARQTEAEWSTCCRIVRITQRDAGFNDDEIVPDAEAANLTERVLFNRAVTLSAMRYLMLEARSLPIPGAAPEVIPPVLARVCLGGRVQGYEGFMPGIFEEVLTTSEKQRPLYLLGGFGGATEILAQAIVTSSPRPSELTPVWHETHTEAFKQLVNSAPRFRLPGPLLPVGSAFDRLWQFIERARVSPAEELRSGLTDTEMRELLTTRDANTALRLVRAGLANQQNLH